MTKSTLTLAGEALAAARAALPRYASRYSRKDFTLHQLFAILVVRRFLRTDYRGVVQALNEWPQLRRRLGLSRVPDHTTLWHAEQKLMKKGISIGYSPGASSGPAASG